MSLLSNMLSRLVVYFSSKEEASFNFKAAVTIYSDFGAEKIKVSQFPLFLHLFAVSDGTGCHDLSFLNVEC